jgi:hypothetical protein
MDPFAERDAFVQQIGNQRMNNQIAFNTSGPNAPQGSPFINYDMARQNAGLGGGAPSMSPEYGDSMIGRLNQSFGGQGNPLAYQQPAPSWAGSGGYNPGWGVMQNPGSAQPQQAPADGPYRSLPRLAYYPGGPGGFPPQETGLRGADDSPASPEYQKWRSQQATTMEWRGPEGEAKREADLHRRWLEETGRAPASGDFRPQRPGSAQPIAPPPQGVPYNPVAAQPAEGASRIDPGTGKPVTYSNGQWSWRPNPVSGLQPYDPARFGDQPQIPAPPPPVPPARGPAWSIPPDRAAQFMEYKRQRGPRDLMYDPERDRREYEQWAAANPVYSNQSQGSSYNPGQPTSQPVWSNKLGRNLTAEEMVAYEEGNRRAEADRDPAEQARRRKMFDDGVYFKPPPTTGYSPPPPPTPAPPKPKSRISGMSVASHVAELEKSYQKQFSDKLNTPKPPPSEAQRLADQEYYRRESERRRADYDVARISNDRFWTAHHAAKNSPAYKGGARLK